MANLNLVTGFAGTPHITANDTGTLNASIFGAGQYVMNYGNKLKASVISNNIVRVLDGVVMMQGRQIRIEDAASVDIAIENGASGYFRNDLIVVRYTKDANTGVEEANLVVIKGTATTGTAADPTFTSGNIFGGAIQNDMPLYRIPIDGINVQEPVALFEITGSFGEHTIDKNNPHKVTCAQIGAAGSKHTHSVEDVKGTLPVEKGGTGAATATGARIALGAAPSEHAHEYSAITGAPVFNWDAETSTLTITVGE